MCYDGTQFINLKWNDEWIINSHDEKHTFWQERHMQNSSMIFSSAKATGIQNIGQNALISECDTYPVTSNKEILVRVKG